ncbi:NB-ARC domains-containing protein [Tanacetum coccineum]
MAELILTALLPVIFEKLTSVAVNKITRSKEIHSELKKWESCSCLKWPECVSNHLAYDIDDILDALATDAMHHEFTKESEGMSSKVRKLIPACCTNFSLSTRMDVKLNSITTRLQELIDEKNNLGLIVKDGGQKSKNRNYQTSLVDAPSIVGREGDKKELLQKLLGDEPCSQNFSIAGFVSLSGLFDASIISKVISSIKLGGESKKFEDLNLLQVALKNQLTGKRFLLVLDDIWSDKLEEWETLAAPFFEVARGSKIIITTRKKELLDIDVEKNVRKEAYKKYRHMSFACEEFMTCKKFKAFERANSLRTFLVMPVVLNSWQTFYLSSKILADILPQLPLLRVLSLSRLNIDETLIVSGCYRLTTLPDSFLKLKNLQHFDIRDTSLWNMMPLGISEMISLQTLSNKIVVENNDFFISWLKNFQGNIHIQGLDKVQSARDIREVNLSQKRGVSELRCWNGVTIFNGARNETLENEVMNALKPHSDNLKDLLIKSYGGKVFPNWIGDPSFLVLTCVQIGGCRKCTFLPPLGQLPSLKKLDIHSLNEVKVVGSEFLGTGIAFPKLESLSFSSMSGWEVWSTNSGVVDAAFPRLQTLAIVDCQNLVEVSFEALPSMRVLRLSGCGDGVLTSLIHVASAVTKLIISSISGLSDEVWRGVMDYLGAVEEVSIYKCNEIRYLWESEAKASKVLVNLRKLEVTDCSKMSLKIDDCEQLLEKELLNPSMPAMLEVVWISSWKNLKSINALTTFIHIKSLEISGCSSVESFPAADLPNLTSLTHLRIINCKNMEVDSFGLWPPKLGILEIGGLKKPISKLGPQNFPRSLVDLTLVGGSAEEDDVSSGSQLTHMLPSSLTTLQLWEFGKLESVSMGLQHLTSLQHLHIQNCRKIEDLPETLLPSLLTLSIWRCPDNLKEKISRRGSYWPLVSYIPRMLIY